MIDRLAASACTLDDDARSARSSRFAALQQRADVSPEAWHFPRELELARELAELAVLEAECCGASFALEIGPNGISFALRP